MTRGNESHELCIYSLANTQFNIEFSNSYLISLCIGNL